MYIKLNKKGGKGTCDCFIFEYYERVDFFIVELLENIGVSKLFWVFFFV